MVWAADIHKGQAVGAVEQLVGGTQVRYRFPDKDRLGVRLGGYDFLTKRGYL
jgi:hypothetical protein